MRKVFTTVTDYLEDEQSNMIQSFNATYLKS